MTLPRFVPLVVLLPLFITTVTGGQNRTLQSFGVRVERGQPVYPLPSNVALGLFNLEDPFLDVAYYAEGRVQVFQNLGNGLFAEQPVYERRVAGEVTHMQWRVREMFYPSPSNLILTYADGREETLTHEQMMQQRRSFASLPQMTSSFPPLNFREVWRSPRNLILTSRMCVADIDNDGRMEVIYYIYEGPPAALGTLIIYENIGNNQYRIDWDTTFNGGYPFAITDIDNDGHKEIVFGYNNGQNCSAVGLLECFGPGQYRFYDTNICGTRPIMKILETDVDHNGIKELSVLFSDSFPQYDRTFVYVAQYSMKGPCVTSCTDWWMSFSPQRLARYNWYVTDFAVGQVDGEGWDEIILGNGGFLTGGGVPEYITYLKYTPPDGPFAWRRHYFSVGLPVLCTAPMFINLDADTAQEMFIGGVGPHGHGSAYAIKHVADSTWRTLWVDSTFRSSPLWVNSGMLYQTPVVAGSNWFEIQNETYSSLRTYSFSGQGLGTWQRDSAVIWMFHLLDIDHDSLPNLVFAQGSLVYGHRAVDFEIPPTLGAESNPSLPLGTSLSQNYPNPFNSTTRITIELQQTTAVELTVYDVLGRRVRSLANEFLEPGLHEYFWDGTNDGSVPLSSGVYLYELKSNISSLRRKMLLLR